MLEATEGALHLLMPTRLDRLVNLLVSWGVFLAFLAALTVFFGIFNPFRGFSVFGAVVAGTLTAVFFIGMYFFSGAGDRLATNVESRLVARRPGCVLNVRVRQIRPGRSGWVQLLELANGGKEEWFTVQATRGELRDALALAGATVT